MLIAVASPLNPLPGRLFGNSVFVSRNSGNVSPLSRDRAMKKLPVATIALRSLAAVGSVTTFPAAFGTIVERRMVIGTVVAAARAPGIGPTLGGSTLSLGSSGLGFAPSSP